MEDSRKAKEEWQEQAEALILALKSKEAEQELEIANIEAEIATHTAEIAFKEAEIASKEVKIAEQQQQIVSNEAQITNKEAEIANKEAEIASGACREGTQQREIMELQVHSTQYTRRVTLNLYIIFKCLLFRHHHRELCYLPCCVFIPGAESAATSASRVEHCCCYSHCGCTNCHIQIS